MDIQVKNNVQKAEDIIERYSYNAPNVPCDRIYPFTNEIFVAYEKYFEGRKKMLSVIGSGDQIFNAILKGTKHVEAFDINKLVKYYFYLKKAAIEVLSREEFIDMFLEFTCDRNKINWFYFERIIKALDPASANFWGNLMQKYGWDWYTLRSSKLFYGTGLLIEDIININPYLSNDGYSRLKEQIRDVSVEVKDGNILDLADEYKKEKYDLIYLSNIWAYLRWDEYNRMQQKLQLTENGCLVAYSFREIDTPFPDDVCQRVRVSKRETSLIYVNKK